MKPEFMHPGKTVQGGIVTTYANMAMAMAAHPLCVLSPTSALKSSGAKIL